MKKSIALLVLGLLFTGHLSAQNGIKNVRSAAYYGVDFSHTKVFGASESDGQFTTIFSTINSLVIDEQKKYNLKNAFGMDFPVQNISRALERSKAHTTDLRTDNKAYRVSDEEIREMVAAYSKGVSESEVGLIIICQLLNKQDNEGVWKIVFFNTTTQEILYSKDAYGKAKGFGLRNFWAGSLYQVLKKWKY